MKIASTYIQAISSDDQKPDRSDVVTEVRTPAPSLMR
ncbi:hypothetical protein L195_g039940, partial [Trifolium pratense]